ncbi:Hypothetical predicted protein, partial [Marmota monax]
TIAARTRRRARKGRGKVGARNFARPGAGERPRRCSRSPRRKLTAGPQEVRAAQPAAAGAGQRPRRGQTTQRGAHNNARLVPRGAARGG